MPGDELPPISALLAAYRGVIAHTRMGRGSIMKDVTAKTAKKIGNQRELRRSSDEKVALQLGYGRIGISAVAAAARYQGDAKNSAYAPVTLRANGRETIG